MTKTKTTQRMLAFIVTFAMVFALVPTHAFATEGYDYDAYYDAELNG